MKITLITLILVAVFRLSVAQHDPQLKHGRTAIVHLFEWRWADITAECERFLGPNGYGGVQISPLNEHIIIKGPWRPWWQRYQPTGPGNENELCDMIRRCNNVGVNIYVDAVINHMCGTGGGEGTHSSCGNRKYFPSVPFNGWDFNDNKCRAGSGNIKNYGDANQVRDCRLVGLLDLALGKDDVRGKVPGFMNKLIDMGVAGFRVDACKHMCPADLQAVYGRLRNLNTKRFPGGARPFIFQEVIDLGGEPITSREYFHLGRVTEFKYGISSPFMTNRPCLLFWNWGERWGFMPNGNALVFVDNQDNQRGHGAGGASIVTFWDARLHKMAVGYMLAHPYGVTRVMSSFRWDRRFENGKVSELEMMNMVKFRNVVNGQPHSNWCENNQVAFGRGNRGFIVFNNDDWNLDMTLNTGMPGGTYCDMISGQKGNGRCTGKQIHVAGDGRAHFKISNRDEDPFLAIHAESKL
uniref:Alpha-amylase n=1 Tax=Neogobius melanostomus TaxID=47308 RepID=A0A8C6UJ36_9GOBI